MNTLLFRQLTKLILFLLVLSIPLISVGQSPVVQWQKSLGGTSQEFGYKVSNTSDGGYIVAGSANSKNGDITNGHGTSGTDAWIVKLTSTGSVQWQKAYGGTAGDIATSIQQTNDGGYIFTGNTASINEDVHGNKGGTDVWVVKLNSIGDTLWTKCYGGSGSETANDIIATTDGGYIVAGTTNSNDGDVSGNHGGNDTWVLKINNTGAIQWQKCYGGSGQTAYGTGELAYSIQETSDGGYVFAGGAQSSDGDLLDSGSYGMASFNGDYWIVKLDVLGNIEWQKILGGTNDDLAKSIQQITDGGFVVIGSSNSTDGDVSNPKGGGQNDCWVVKLNSTGNLIWDKSFGGTNADEGQSVCQASNGNYTIAAYTNSTDGDIVGSHGNYDIWVAELDPLGNIEWSKTLGGTKWDQAMSIQQTTDNGYIVAGRSQSSDGDASSNKGQHDYWIVKISSCPAFTALTATICEGVNYDFNGTLLTTAGTYKDTLQTTGGCDSIITLTLNVNPVYHTPLSHAICAGDSYDFFGTLLTTADSYQHTLQSISGCDSIITLTLTLNPLPAPTITANGSELSTGTFSSYQWLLDDVAIADAITQSYTVSAEGNYRVVVTESNSCSDTSAVHAYVVTGIENTTESGISIYPNPVSDVVNIRYENNLPFNVSIFSMQGQEVLSQVCTANNALLDIHSLPQGFYIVKVFQNKELKTIQKLVKK